MSREHINFIAGFLYMHSVFNRLDQFIDLKNIYRHFRFVALL